MFHRQQGDQQGEEFRRGVATSTLLLGLFALAAIAVLVWTSICPCERIPGGYLVGSDVEEPVSDWSFVNDAGLCQIQVRRGLLPHAINLNCMADGGELFLSCARCEGKAWSTAALNNPEARLRVDGRVFPVTLTKLDDAATLDRAWRARAGKLGRPTDSPRQEGWWSFRVESRSG